MVKKIDSIRVNRQIHAKTVRLIALDGSQLGIVTIQEALDAASEHGLDLVEVSPNSDPPVCRVMDYGKFKYQASKREQGARKKGKAFQVKEIKLRPHTEEHDLGFKIRNLRRFLDKKNRVKVTVIFRGREIAYKDVGKELLERVAEEVMDQGTVEQPPREEGRNLSMFIVPK
ncbi:MAG: translation initiation factor IF-3 [Deltaproteobacteria bacterium]|nr:MAG: translation initiation factor IF-3 [Deltaproteobacteria bacterium]